MAKKKKEHIAPLEMTEVLLHNDPHIWTKLYTEGVADILKIKKYCLEMGYKDSAALLYALTEWRRHKMIFDFHEELVELLMDINGLDDDIPCEVLMQLPYNGIYIKLPSKMLNVTRLKTIYTEVTENMAIDGFFFYVDTSIGAIAKESPYASIVTVFEDQRSLSVGFSLEKGKSLRQGMSEIVNPNEDVLRISNTFLQLVLYLCAVNADIEENYEQKEIYEHNHQPQQETQQANDKKENLLKTPESDKDKASVPDSFKELRKWDVGYRYGAAVKRIKKEQKQQKNEYPKKEGSHARKRTHSRRGHLHSFWRGSQKDGTRQIFVKWLSPIIVNGQYENIVTIRKVK